MRIYPSSSIGIDLYQMKDGCSEPWPSAIVPLGKRKKFALENFSGEIDI